MISPESLRPYLSQPLHIHAETRDWMVVEKPPFLPIHPSKPGDAHTLWHRLRDVLAFELVNGGQVSIVNRLDRETSGLVLVAKNRHTARAFCQAMERREMRKAYLAIVWGHPPQEAWEIDAPILRQGERGPSLIYLKQAIHPEGAPALTRFRLEHRFRRAGEPFSVVRAEPVTGRMHQIRLHLAHAGHPVVGDKLYGPSEKCYLEFIATGWTPSLAARLRLPRHALHSAELATPGTPAWRSPLPPDLRAFLEAADCERL